MTGGSPVLPLAGSAEPACYVLIDDEPRYRQAIDVPDGLNLSPAGSYGAVEAFITIQRQPCHVVALDLCLNRQTDPLHQALRKLAASCRDIRLSDTLEGTLTLLETGMSDREIARERQLSVRTIEDHKRKILEIFGTTMEARHQGFAGLSRDLGIRPGDLVNDRAGQRPTRGLIGRAMPWTRSDHRAHRSGS